MGTQLPSPKRGRSPQFSAHVCCGQMAGWIKMPLGLEVGLGLGDCVKWGPSSSLPRKGAEPPQILGHCFLWPNGWMDQGGTWRGGRPQPRQLCVRWVPRPSPQRGRSPSPILGSFLLWPNGWMAQAGTWHGGRPQTRRLCVRWGPSPLPKTGVEPLSPIFGPFLLWPNGWMDQAGTWHRGSPRPRQLC